MATTAGGIGFLVLMGLIAVGYSDGGSSAQATAGAEQEQDETLATCDGVLVVETATGSARVPGDTDPPDGDATALCRMDMANGDDDAVAALQHALVQCHGEALTVDGRYGPETAAAVTAVQQQAGIAIDGEYGPATMEVMHWPVDGTTGTPECVAIGSHAAADDTTSMLPPTG
jgi:peptidoglycan hydrolase-like protein with peptidoglycan-binding domain